MQLMQLTLAERNELVWTHRKASDKHLANDPLKDNFRATRAGVTAVASEVMKLIARSLAEGADKPLDTPSPMDYGVRQNESTVSASVS